MRGGVGRAAVVDLPVVLFTVFFFFDSGCGTGTEGAGVGSGDLTWVAKPPLRWAGGRGVSPSWDERWLNDKASGLTESSETLWVPGSAMVPTFCAELLRLKLTTMFPLTPGKAKAGDG